MTEREIVESNKILEIVTGSHLYGTNTEASDKDYVGIFMPDKSYIYGFKKCEEVDLSIKDKLNNGKNSEKAVDRFFHEYRKFIKLAMENNPNVLEILFVNIKNIVFINDRGHDLLIIKHLFPYQGLKDKFLGYAISQKHKMQIRSDKFKDLETGLNLLENDFQTNDKMTIIEYYTKLSKHFHSIFREGLDNAQNVRYISVGDLNLQPSYTLLKCKKIIKDRLSKVGNRKTLIIDKGYDFKFGSHLIRLLVECKELLFTGEIVFPLKEKDTILDIKKGNWKIEDVLRLSEELENEINTIKSDLPIKPNYDKIEKFTINSLEDYLKYY
jgi:uncharacterized protein